MILSEDAKRKETEGLVLAGRVDGPPLDPEDVRIQSQTAIGASADTTAAANAQIKVYQDAAKNAAEERIAAEASLATAKAAAEAALAGAASAKDAAIAKGSDAGSDKSSSWMSNLVSKKD